VVEAGTAKKLRLSDFDQCCNNGKFSFGVGHQAQTRHPSAYETVKVALQLSSVATNYYYPGKSSIAG
jgi:hypothetical protein